MLTPQQCLAKYGPPSDTNKCMVLWDVPAEIEIGIIPNRLYCNKDLIVPATAAFTNLVKSGAVNDLLTFDGCFNIRPMRGRRLPSLHSWAVALDFDAFRNGLGKKPTMTKRVVECFLDTGLWDWLGKQPLPYTDGMHFQLRSI